MTAQTHLLKTVQPFYNDVAAGRKTAELRFNDRGYAVGDILLLALWSGLDFTGPRVMAEITHIVTDADGPWLAPGHVMLSFKQLHTSR